MRSTDNAWIMVEDEFISTAHLFTQHLHHAEYKRLKRIAAQKSVEALNAIVRPVDARTEMSVELKKRKEADAKRRAATEALQKSCERRGIQDKRRSDDSEDDEEEMAIGDKNLAGLMVSTGTRKKVDKIRLTSLVGEAKSNTRAAAGYDKQKTKPRAVDRPRMYDIPGVHVEPIPAPIERRYSQEKTSKDEHATESNDEDDLDAPVPAVQRKMPSSSTASAPRKPPTSAPAPKQANPPSTTATISPHLRKNVAISAPTTSPSTTASHPNALHPSPIKPPPTPQQPTNPSPSYLFDDLPQPRTSPLALARRRKAREAARKEKEARAVIRADEIPTFLV